MTLLRLLSVVLVVAVAGCGADDDVVGSPEPISYPIAPASEVCMRYGEDAKFIETLLELRKSWDLYPWAESEKASLAAGTAEGSTFFTQHKLPEAIIVSELTSYAYEHYVAGGDTFAERTFGATWKQLIGSTEVEQLREPFPSDHVFGFYRTEWLRLGRGLLLPANRVLRVNGTSFQAVGAGGIGLRIDNVLRGYKLLPKGSIVPQQLTVDEWQQRGRTLGAFKEGAVIEVPAAADTPIYETLVLDEDFVVEAISIGTQVNSVGATYPDVEVKIHADRPLVNDWTNRFALVGFGQETRWDLPLPLTSKKSTTWRFEARRRVTAPAATDLSFVLHGYRMK